MGNTIRISGIIELEIELPDGMIFNVSGATKKPKKSPTVELAEKHSPFDKSPNGQIAKRLAACIKRSGNNGITIAALRKQFPAIKSPEHFRMVAAKLPALMYRKNGNRYTYTF